MGGFGAQILPMQHDFEPLFYGYRSLPRHLL